MKKTLKIIKDKYGEKMAHFSRENFATILENDSSLLPVLLQELFSPNHELYNDIEKYHLNHEFIEFIYGFVSMYEKQRIQVKQTPEELLRTVGYTLYECHTEEDIMKFKKYYAPGEELCTFRDERLNKWYVYFAVHDDAEKLQRESFLHPQRQDKYGTSVISIQFSKNDSHILSIKNRYNHTVSNPDATFGNDLDNIVPGLSKAFENHKGMTCKNSWPLFFEIPGYVQANDGKYYKYNLEINNIYYCTNNVIIDNYDVIEYPKEKYLIINYFIINFQDKTISLYDRVNDEYLIEMLGNIKNIEIIKGKHEKKIIITNTINEKFEIKITTTNNIISVSKLSGNKRIRKRW